VLVKIRKAHIVLLIGCLLVANQLGLAARDPTSARVRQIILHTRHLGAHGLGYNDRSRAELAERLTAADIPALIDLLADPDVRAGAQFALAVQCEAAISPVHDAVIERKVDAFYAFDIMDWISTNSECSEDTRERAIATRAELKSWQDEEWARAQEEHKRQAAEDARIQRNALKLLDPEQAKTLTREEREEAYHRSLKAMGLSEDGPMTPAQKDLVQRMYRTMVLGESGPHSPQN
jgi:hypothetical protein